MRFKHCWSAGAAVSLFGFAVFAAENADVPHDTKAPLGHIGAFNSAVSYVWEFVPAELSLDAHPWGADVSEAWIYARVFTKSHKQYVLMRTVKDLTSAGVTLTTDGQKDARVPRTAGDVARTVDVADGLVFAGKDFKVQYSPTAVKWTDQQGGIVLQGAGSPLARVGTAAFMPYVKDGGTTGLDIYTGQYQPVTGTVFGEPVEGMFIVDHFIGIGEKFGGSHLSRNQTVWSKFANVYADGSVEIGEIFTETNGMIGGVVSDGSKVIAQSHEPTVKFEFDKQSKLVKETWTIGDQQWEMRPDGTGETALGNTGLVQIWGAVNRVGDKRKPTNQFAITEYRIHRLSPSQRN